MAEEVASAWTRWQSAKSTLIAAETAVAATQEAAEGIKKEAVGGNRTAAELSGINAIKVVWLLYILVGAFAAMAGMARASYMSLGDPLSGDGMELTCIIAVLLGGTAFAGGEGSVAKTMIGAMIIQGVQPGPSVMTEQPGDDPAPVFSYLGDAAQHPDQAFVAGLHACSSSSADMRACSIASTRSWRIGGAMK